MKLSKTILILTEPIAFIFTAVSITLMCWADFTTISGFWLMLLGIALFAISLGYLLFGIFTLSEMKDFKKIDEMCRKKVLLELTNNFKEFEMTNADFTDLISSKDNVKCLAKLDKDSNIHYQITIEETSEFHTPFVSHFKVPE